MRKRDVKGARRSLSDRGASAIEYGLVLAVFVIAVLGTLDVLYDNTSDFYDESSQGVGAIPTWSLSSTTVTAGGGGVTTTAAPTTTTAPSAQSFIANLVDDSRQEGDGDWTAEARVNIHRDDTNGNVQGAVVSGRFTTADGDVNSALCTTDASGECQMSWTNRNSADSPTLFEVTNVVANPSWDGSTLSIPLVEP